VLELAAAIKREKLGRTATQVARIRRAPVRLVAVGAHNCNAISNASSLAAPTMAASAPAFGRFEATRPNEL
jgi:hypothetical protein